MDSALASKQKLNLWTGDTDMPVSQRCQSEGIVLAGILFISDTDRRCLQQPDNRCQHLIPVKFVDIQVAGNPGSNFGQAFTKRDHAMVLRAITGFSPSRMEAGIVCGRVRPGPPPGDDRCGLRISRHPTRQEELQDSKYASEPVDRQERAPPSYSVGFVPLAVDEAMTATLNFIGDAAT